MTYDNERRLATWQNTPSNPTSTASYWYDGEGNRVAQTLNGITTYYVGSDEEITGSTLLKYYHIPGLPVLGTITGVTRTYLASDGLGSETVDLSYNGSVLATALYGPYGVGRYATGTMPTSRGYTGQRQDSGSGLDYYGARYYDAAVGQFTSADTVQGPNRYAYVGGNPETATDPTGKCFVICAIAGAVIGGVGGGLVSYGSQVISNISNGDGWNSIVDVDGGKILQGIGTGALWGAVIGGTGGLAGLPAIGAIGDATSGVVTALGGSDALAAVAGSAATSGTLGMGEGLVQGLLSGDRGTTLLGDVFAGGAIGAVSGGAGSYFGRLVEGYEPLMSGRALARLTNAAANVTANFGSQIIQDARGRGRGFDVGSLLVSGVVGARLGYLTGDDPAIGRWGSAIGSGLLDVGSQGLYYVGKGVVQGIANGNGFGGAYDGDPSTLLTHGRIY